MSLASEFNPTLVSSVHEGEFHGYHYVITTKRFGTTVTREHLDSKDSIETVVIHDGALTWDNAITLGNYAYRFLSVEAAKQFIIQHINESSNLINIKAKDIQVGDIIHTPDNHLITVESVYYQPEDNEVHVWDRDLFLRLSDGETVTVERPTKNPNEKLVLASEIRIGDIIISPEDGVQYKVLDTDVLTDLATGRFVCEHTTIFINLNDEVRILKKPV